jgi:hypothetical protein
MAAQSRGHATGRVGVILITINNGPGTLTKE